MKMAETIKMPLRKNMSSLNATQSKCTPPSHCNNNVIIYQQVIWLHCHNLHYTCNVLYFVPISSHCLTGRPRTLKTFSTTRNDIRIWVPGFTRISPLNTEKTHRVKSQTHYITINICICINCIFLQRVNGQRTDRQRMRAEWTIDSCTTNLKTWCPPPTIDEKGIKNVTHSNARVPLLQRNSLRL